MVCREIVQQEERSWSDLYPVCDFSESAGKVKRGYFVSGLSGLQYIIPSALEKLRLPVSTDLPDCWVFAWEDPANFLHFYSGEGTDSLDDFKVYGDYIVFQTGVPILTATGKKLKLNPLKETSLELLKPALEKLLKILCLVYPDQKISVIQYDGQPIQDKEPAAILQQLGFEKGYQEMVLWPSKRL